MNQRDKGIPEVHIRQFNFQNDFPAVTRLWNNGGSGVQLSPSDTPKEIQKKLGRDPDLFLVAVSEEIIVGTVFGGFDGRRGIAYHLVTDPDMRNQGIGSSLMKELEMRLKVKGCIRCYLMVTPENEYAMQFYKSLGWERIDIVPFGKNL